jgi:serine phosphatase RsbU (regulator of sigma subunit)
MVEDSQSDADLLIRFLNKEKITFTNHRVWNKIDFEKALASNLFDLIISDQTLPTFSGMEAFRIAKKASKSIPFILVTGSVSESLLIEFTKEGVDDYILKENLLRLPSSIKHLIANKKIEILHQQLEQAYKDITDSINYAKKIQNAMLPDSAQLKDQFQESYIIFKPKDNLSGDFYWMKNEQNTFFIAAADCTGHGIPGALMSMVGIEKLNNAVISLKEPKDILQELNKSIEVALCQSTLYAHSQDGMDIALCAINKETSMLNFSAANRPLWIIRNNNINSNSQLNVEEIKGTKKAIGGLTNGLKPEFEYSQIQLQKGDTVYLFTDGIVDQFGGQEKKKLMAKRFKEQLVQLNRLNMDEQKNQLITFINNWKGNEEQVDDILIIAIRI